MKNILYWRIRNDGSGMTNQIFTFITGILTALNFEKNIIVLDDFNCDYLEGKEKPISQIIDIKELNDFLKKNNLNVVLFDKNDICLNIHFITYGISNQVIDVTQQMMKHCYTFEKDKNEQRFYLSKNVSFNEILGDPFPEMKKKLTIHYSLNEYLFKEEYEEDRKEDLLFDLKNAPYLYRFAWINTINQPIFEKIIENISFHKDFQTIADVFLEKKIKNKNSSKINVIHLRLEEDAIKYWSKQNVMSCEDYQKRLEEKYISIIEKNIQKDEENILLSYSTKNRVIEFLEENGYSYHFIEKDQNKGREWNAIVDLHIALSCNHLFINSWNPEQLSGSTFSYIVSKKLDKKVKKIFLDPDYILIPFQMLDS